MSKVNGNQLKAELIAAGVPAMAACSLRVSLGKPHKTKYGQWVFEADGSLSWVGTGKKAKKPSADLVELVAKTRADHVPAKPKKPMDVQLVIRALIKTANGKLLGPEEQAELIRAEDL